jgi:hypothetical protein
MRGVGLFVMCLALAGGTAAHAAEALIANLAFEGTLITSTNRATVGQLITVESDDAFGDGATEVKVGVLTYDGIIITASNDLTVETGSIEGNNITTNAVGQFKVSFRVPSVAYGTRSVVVRERATDTWVQPRLISVSPIAVVKGDSLSVVGDGFRSGAAVRVELVQVLTGGSEVGPHPTDGDGYGELTADSTGRIDGTIVVGSAPFADGSATFPLHTVRVKDSHDDYEADVRASLGNVVSVSPILETNSFGTKGVGGEITLKGRGFPAPSGIGASLSVTIGGSVATFGSADATGSINGDDGIAYAIPSMTYGTRDVKVSDTSTGSASATASSAITIAPRLILTGALQATNGESLSFTGTGFASHDGSDDKNIKTDGTGSTGEDVSITLVKSGIVYAVTTSPSPITADATTGAVASSSFTVPLALASSGDVTIQAQGTISGAIATNTFFFSRPSAQPEVRIVEVSSSSLSVHKVSVVSVSDVNPGDLIGVRGINFPSSSSIGTLRLRKGFTATTVAAADLTDAGGPDGIAVGTADNTTGAITTDAGGSFAVTLQLSSDIEGGTWTVEATGAAATAAVVDISPGGFQLINPDTSLVVSSLDRLVEESIRVSAGGFLSGETVTIQVGATTKAVTDNGDDDANATAGVIQADVELGHQPFGTEKVAIAHARGTLTTDGEVNVLNNIIRVDLNTSLVGATVEKQLGDTIQFGGRGFTANGPVSIWLDTDQDLSFNADNDTKLLDLVANQLGSFLATVPVSNAGVVGVSSLTTPFLVLIRDEGAKDNETLPTGSRNTASIQFTTTDDDPIATHTSSASVGDTFTLRGTVTAGLDLGILTLDGSAWDFNDGDDPGATLDKIIDNGTNDADGVAGAVLASFTVPALTRGIHTVQLKNQAVTFTVNSNATVNEGGGDTAIGGTIKVDATGFGGSEVVQLKLGDAVIGSASASSAGSADAVTGTIPTALTAGNYTINVVGASSGASVELADVVTVVPSIASLSPEQGTTLTSLTVTGEGFTAGEPVTITFDGSSVGDPVNTNTIGQLDTTFTVPSKPFNRDGHEVVLIGSQTSTNPGGKFFLLEAALLQAPDQQASFKVGDVVLVRGSGYGNGVGGEEAVSFSVAGTTPTSVARDGWTSTTDGSLPGVNTSNGGFGKDVDAADIGVTIPSIPGGIQSLTAAGATSGQTKNVTLNVTPSASIVSGSSALVGSLVEIDVFGFAAETELQFLVGGVMLAFGDDEATKTAADGSQRTKVVVADAGTGNQTITVQQAGTTDPVTGGILATTVSDAFSVGGQVTLVGGKESADWPVGAAVGTAVTVTGSGFTPGKVVDVFLGSADGPKAAVSGNVVQANGTLGLSLVVPARGASSVGLDIVIDGDPGSDDDALVVATGALQVTASLTVSPVSGTAGSTVLTINGSGFPLGNVTLTIRADTAAAGSGLLVGGNGTANASSVGVLSPAFQAVLTPGATSGPKKIDALDGSGNVLASADFVVSAAGGSASLSIADSDGSTTSGPVGSQITVTGSGFAGNTSLPLTFDSVSVPLTARGVGSISGANAITDSSGAFKVEFTVPAREGGDRKVAVGGQEATYTVDSAIALSSTENVAADQVISITGSGFTSTKDLMVQWERIDSGGSTELVFLTQDATAFFATGLRTDTNDTDGLFTDVRVGLSDAVQGGLIWSKAATSGRTFRAKTDGSFVVAFTVSEVPFLSGGRTISVVETQTTTSNSESPGGSVVAQTTVETIASGLSLEGTIRNASQNAPSGALWTSGDGLGQNDGVIAISAKGFAASSAVTVKIGDSTIQTLLADNKGAVSGSVIVTGQTNGEKTLELSNASGDADKETLSAKFSVLPELVIYGVGGVKPTAQNLGQATLGTSVSVFGLGFKDDGDKEVTVSMGAHSETELEVASDGTFSVTFTLPSGDDSIAGGPVLIQAVGKGGETDSETFTVLPRVTVVNDDIDIGLGTQAAIVTNDKVKVSGDGFTANTAVTLRVLESGTAGNAVIATGNVTDSRGRLVDARFTATELKRPESARNVRAITPAATIDSTNTFRRSPSITGLSPASGQSGTSITVSGQGFPSNLSTFQVQVAGVAVTSVTTTEGTVSGGLITPTETGRITASFTAPTLGTTGASAVKLVSGTESAQKSFIYSDPSQTATLTIINDVSDLKPGDTVQVRGHNYNGASIIGELLFDADSGLLSPQRPTLKSIDVGSWGVSLGKVRSDENGVFKVSFPVPVNTTDSVAGLKYIGAGVTGEVTTSVTLQNKMTRSVDTTTPGGVVTVTGAGFAAETVLGKIALDGASLDGSGNVDDGSVKTTTLGTFAVSVTIPAIGESGISAGNHALTLNSVNTDLDGGDDSLNLIGTVKASATPSTAAIGDLITVSAEGLAPTSGSDTVTVMFDDAKVATLVDRKAGNAIKSESVSTDSGGDVAFTFNVPSAGAGSHQIRLVQDADAGGNGNTAIDFGIAFTVTGSVVVLPSSGVVGDSLTVTGTGFGANSTVFVDFGSASNAATVAANSAGSFTAKFDAPAQPNGSVTVTARSSTATAAGAFAVNESIAFLINGAAAEFTAGSFTANVGDNVTVQGNGFAPGVAADVTLGNGQTVSSATNSVGSVAQTFTVSETSSHTTYQPQVGSFGSEGDDGVETLTVGASVFASPSSARAGDEVVVTGRGFSKGTKVSIYLGKDSAGNDELAVDGTNVAVDTSGSFTNTVKVGSAVVPASDTKVKAGAAEADFVILVSEAKLTVKVGADEVSKGTVGTLLTVTPSAATFGASENVQVSFANQNVILQQAISGTFTTNFAVPVTPGGTKQIRAVGQTTGETRTALFDVIPNITSISESLFDLGETVTITGNGAGAGDSLQVMLATAKDDSALEDAVADTSAPVTITGGSVADSSGIYQLTFQVDNRIFDQDRTQVRLKVVSVSSGVESDWFGTDSDIAGGLEIITKGVRLSLSQTSGAGDATLTVTGFAADESGNARLNANIGSVTLQHQFVSGGSRVVVPSSDLTVSIGLEEGDTVRTDSSGKFEVVFPIGTATQPKPGGLLTISISGENVNYTITPQLRAVDASGTTTSQLELGDTYTLEGLGYFPLQSVAVAFDGSALDTSSATTTDAFGKFTTTFGTPDVLGGLHTVTGAGSFSSTQTTLAVIGTITSPEAVLQAVVRGDMVDVTGVGFGADEELTFTVGPATVAAADVVDGMSAADGTFASTIAIPAVAAGEHDLVVSSASSTAILAGAFTISSSVTANPDKSKAGADLTVSGSGWAAFSAVAIEIVGENPTTVTTDTIGSFSTTITLAGEKADGSVVNVTATSGDIVQTTTFTYDGSAAAQDVAVDPATAVGADGTITVSANIETGATATFSIAGVVGATGVAMAATGADAPDGFVAVAGSHVAAADGDVADAAVTVAVTDALGNAGSFTADATVTIDTVAPALGDSSADPATARNGMAFTITVNAEAGLASVTADVSDVDTTQTDPVSLEEGEAGVYTVAVLVSTSNAAETGDKTIAVTAADEAGNETTNASAIAIRLQAETSFTIALHAGVNLIHVPVRVDGLSNASDLFEALGGSDDVGLIVMLNDAGKFVAFTTGVEPGSPADVALGGGSGAIVVMKKSKAVTFSGGLLGTDVALSQGINVIGVPRDGAVATAGDIADLSADVQRVIREENGRFVAVVSTATDADVSGGAAYIVLASADATLTLDGGAWENSAAAAPITNVAYNTDASPVFLVQGSLMREDTLDVINGIEVTVTNMRTGDTLTDTVGRSSGAGRFSTTFLSLGGAEYKVGDTFELRVVDPSGTFGGVRDTQRIITREDMRSGRLDLGSILLSAVPERSALLPNYPNPFNPETWIPFQLSTESAVTVSIYNAAAQRIRTLDIGYLPAGTYTSRPKAAYWDGSNDMGERVSSGVYFYRIEAGSFSEMRRMVILK